MPTTLSLHDDAVIVAGDYATACGSRCSSHFCACLSRETSNFFEKSLTRDNGVVFDTHVVSTARAKHFQAPETGNPHDFVEMMVEDSAQVLPLASMEYEVEAVDEFVMWYLEGDAAPAWRGDRLQSCLPAIIGQLRISFPVVTFMIILSGDVV